MDKDNSRLETKSNAILGDQAIIENCIKEGDELYLRRGKQPGIVTAKGASANVTKKDAAGEAQHATLSTSTSATSSHAPGSVTCKRFGCGKRFVPGQPPSEPCRHHKKPPVFHETRKYWACCPDKVAWDWESFQDIVGCEELPEHTNVADGTKKVMGGTEVRAEIQGPREIVAEKKVTGLDKLLALRSSLVSIGVDGDVFDRARDAIKRVHEDAEGKNVWEKVCGELGALFENALKSADSK